MAGRRVTPRVVLAVDTAGPVIGVALWREGEVWQRTERITRGAETRLVPWAEALCAARGLAVADVDGFVVSHGPGAFTGLRVGLATALGWSIASGKPVVGLCSLRARAGLETQGRKVLSVLDARKSRFYAAWYQGGTVLREPADLSESDVFADMHGPFVAVGEGALVLADAIAARGGQVLPGADDPAVAALAALGAQALLHQVGDPGDLHPTYLRAPDAQPR